MQGTDLLSLPEEVLQVVAEDFTLTDWVQGPARACKLLYRLKLPKVHLQSYHAKQVRTCPLHPTVLSYLL